MPLSARFWCGFVNDVRIDGNLANSGKLRGVIDDIRTRILSREPGMMQILANIKRIRELVQRNSLWDDARRLQ